MHLKNGLWLSSQSVMACMYVGVWFCVCVCVRPRTFSPILDLARASVCIPELCNVLCCYLNFYNYC